MMGVCIGRGFIISNNQREELESPAVFIMERPVTDVKFVSSPDNCPKGYTMVRECPCGHDANLWVKFLGAKSEERYLCYTKEERDDGKIVEDMYIPGKGERYIVKGFEVIKKTVEGDDTLNHRFIAYKRVDRKRASTAVFDAAVFRSKDNPASTFKKLGAKLNNLYICIRVAKYKYNPSDHNQATPTPSANTRKPSVDKPAPPLQKRTSQDKGTPPVSYQSSLDDPSTQSGATPTSYQPSPPTQGYNAPPTSYGSPPTQEYAPPINQGYSTPPTNQGYSAPPTNQSYSIPPTNQGYNAPPTNQGYSASPTNQGYNAPPTNYGYNAPPTNYPPVTQSYNPPPTSYSSYGSPPSSNAPPTNPGGGGGVALGFENLDLDQPIPEDWTWEDEDEDEQSDSMRPPVHEMATLSMTPNLSSAPPPPPGAYGFSSPSYPTSYGPTGYYGNTPSYPAPPQPSGYAPRYPPPPSNQYGYMHSTGQPPYQQAPPPSNPAYQQAPPPGNRGYGGYPGQFPPPSHGGGHIGFNI